MKTLAALAFASFLGGTLAEDVAIPSSCITSQRVLPTITFFSCPGDINPTKTIPSSVQTQPSEPHAEVSPLIPGIPGAEEPGDGSSGQGAEQPDSGSGGSDSGAPQSIQPSTTLPAVVPDNSNTPDTVPVAGALVVRYDMAILGIAGMLPLAVACL